ncbi:MAG: hypothetical protein ACFE95_03580 [Candidatus Hodarchaeota archaeon]
MEIELFVWSKGDIGAISSADREMIIHPYCAPEQYSHTMKSLGKGVMKGPIKGILSADEQLVISRLVTAIESVESNSINIVLRDNRYLFTRLRTWYKHRTTNTPLVVIGNQCIQGTPSVEELTKAINGSI